jgi:hypothetical protein
MVDKDILERTIFQSWEENQLIQKSVNLLMIYLNYYCCFKSKLSSTIPRFWKSAQTFVGI